MPTCEASRRIFCPVAKDAKVAEKQIELQCFLCVALGHFVVTEPLPVLVEAMESKDSDAYLPVRQFAIQSVAVLAANVGGEKLREADA